MSKRAYLLPRRSRISKSSHQLACTLLVYPSRLPANPRYTSCSTKTKLGSKLRYSTSPLFRPLKPGSPGMRMNLNIPPLLSTKTDSTSHYPAHNPFPLPHSKIPRPFSTAAFPSRAQSSRATPTPTPCRPYNPFFPPWSTNPQTNPSRTSSLRSISTVRPPSVQQPFHHFVQQSQHPRHRTPSPLQILLPILPTSHTLVSSLIPIYIRLIPDQQLLMVPRLGNWRKYSWSGFIGKAPDSLLRMCPWGYSWRSR